MGSQRPLVERYDSLVGRLTELRAEHDRVQDQLWAARTLLVRSQAFVPPGLLAEVHEFLNSKPESSDA